MTDTSRQPAPAPPMPEPHDYPVLTVHDAEDRAQYFEALQQAQTENRQTAYPSPVPRTSPPRRRPAFAR